jgi:hypothetical protein
MLRITPLDESAVSEGRWTVYRGVHLLVARANNTKFINYFKKLTAPYKRDMEAGRLSEEISADILTEALGKYVLLNWKNFVVNGKEVEYTHENAKSLLLNDSDCRDYVMSFAEDLENFLIEDKNETVGE